MSVEVFAGHYWKETTKICIPKTWYDETFISSHGQRLGVGCVRLGVDIAGRPSSRLAVRNEPLGVLAAGLLFIV